MHAIKELPSKQAHNDHSVTEHNDHCAILTFNKSKPRHEHKLKGGPDKLIDTQRTSAN